MFASGLGRLRGPGRAGLSGEDGFLLLEVIISALLVALIVVATFTGFEAVDNSTASERTHSEASVLAVQSQDQLRADPVSTLEKLVLQPHSYTIKVDGITYTVTQGAKELNGSGQTTACAATEHNSSPAPNYKVSSSVVWGGLSTGKPVVESTIITPPTGSAVEVDVGNGEAPTVGVAGVTAAVTYTPIESVSTVKLEGTTGPAGCVLFTGIRSTAARVEIREKPNFVTPSGALKVEPAEVAIAPNVTTHDPVAYDEGGAIEAAFTYEKATTAKGKAVSGDTFAVVNPEIAVLPELEVGGIEFAPEEVTGAEKYAVKTGFSAWAPRALTAKNAHFAKGDLFPFPKTKWTVFAGDCSANNPATVTHGAVKPAEVLVNPGSISPASVPTSYVNLESYQGSEKAPSPKKTTAAYEVKILNTSCSATPPPLPNNAEAVTYAHYQTLSAEGTLEHPFQPFGSFELCVQASLSPERRDKLTYTNQTESGSSFKVYPEELTQAEKRAKREAEEATARATHEKEEKTAKEKRETEEAPGTVKRQKEEEAEKETKTKEEALKTTKLKEEETAKENWIKEEKAKGKPTKKEREAKEKALKETREKEEKTAREKREKEEAATKKVRETEETTRQGREKAEETTRTTRITTEEAAKKAAEKAEELEATEKAVRVAKGAPAVEAGKC